MKQGVYEHIISQEIKDKIIEAEQSGLVCIHQQVDEAESPQMLANYLAKVIRQKLEDTEKQQDRVDLINRIMEDVGLIEGKKIIKHKELLTEVLSQQQAVMQSESRTQTIRPISGFRVSGYFRLQPYADGSKRLIWINEFVRHGYHRKALIDRAKEGEEFI